MTFEYPEEVAYALSAESEARYEDNERLRALLREAWMLTGDAQLPAYLRDFHNRLDAQAYDLGLRLPR